VCRRRAQGRHRYSPADAGIRLRCDRR
jgi:hypothetical protein